MYIYAGGLELDIIWQDVSAAAAVHDEALSPSGATQWRLHASDPAQASSYGHRMFLLQARTLCVPRAGGASRMHGVACTTG